jgi:molecular chaperone GrpE
MMKREESAHGAGPVDGDTDQESTGKGAADTPEDIQQKLELAIRETEQLKEQLLRKAAEFENYKRRMEIEFRSIIENASERLITDLLPVLDDFDRLLKSARKETGGDVLSQGFELIASKLSKILSLRGVQPFESVGKPFDVNYHDALLQMPRTDVPPNTVVEEVDRGYKLNDKVIRHAKVIVSTPADDSLSAVPPQAGNSSGRPPEPTDLDS